MIHAVDLSTIVKRLVLETPEDHEYINAIDFAPNRSQSKLISTISEAMGGIEIEQVSYLNAIFNDDYNILTINVNLIPTDLLGHESDYKGQDDPRRTYAEGESRHWSPGKRYVWKYRNGFSENFDAIYQEFKMFRNLKTIKLAVVGLASTHVNLYGEE